MASNSGIAERPARRSAPYRMSSKDLGWPDQHLAPQPEPPSHWYDLSLYMAPR